VEWLALRTRTRGPVAVVVLVGIALALSVSPARAARQIPIGMYNVNNQVMNSGQYAYAIRFVSDTDTTVHRFLSGFNMEGAGFLGGRDGYADGDGGVIRARLVTVNPDGTPNLANILAEESVPAATRYAQAKTAYGASGITQLLYFNMGGAPIQAGRMHAMVYTNAAGNPSANWFSENSPTVKESVAGPNGRNTLDADAAGAIAGLDPREAVAWSTDGGSSWVWGRAVGAGPTPGSYAGSSSGDDGTRLPWYGIQPTAAAKPESNQPYYAYRGEGTYTLSAQNAPRAVTLTQAGGYGPSGEGVGVVTVRNLTTGETAKTASLGGGLARGSLDRPVTVNKGDSYEISHTGTVFKQEADTFIDATFGVGAGRWPFSTAGNGDDVAELFALPHPWFGPTVVATDGGATAGAPAAAEAAGRSTPRVGLNFPHDAHRFESALRISVGAKDPDGIERVRFYLDGKRIGIDTKPPFRRIWRIPKGLRRGRHVLMSKAVDPHHKIGFSKEIVVKHVK